MIALVMCSGKSNDDHASSLSDLDTIKTRRSREHNKIRVVMNWLQPKRVHLIVQYCGRVV